MGQTLGDAQADFDLQESSLKKNFEKYLEVQAELFVEKTRDTKGKLTRSHVSRLRKTHEAWMKWAEMQARDLIAAEPVGKQEALLLITKAWLYEQKSRELGREVGGPEYASQPLIDDTRVHIGPIAKGFEPYRGKVGESGGVFALQWMDAKSVRGSFASADLAKTFRVFGDVVEEGVIEFLFVTSGDDEGTEVKMEKKREGERVFWEGRAEMLGKITMEEVVMAVREGEVIESTYRGKTGRTKIALRLRWSPDGKIRGAWAESGSGVSSELRGLNYEPGFLYLDRWENGGGEGDEATVSAMWFLKKSKSQEGSWSGKVIHLNGYEEVVSFSK